jgi:hypothetical protein
MESASQIKFLVAYELNWKKPNYSHGWRYDVLINKEEMEPI